jgi:hypothetical protein
LTPITKAYATDMGVEMASLGVQLFGGMGFVEETGAAQHYRDARIAPIYEGTNGIQAMDLVARKLPQGHWRALFADMRADIGDAGPLADALGALEQATAWLLAHPGDDAAAGASPYLRMSGITLGGWLLLRQANAAKALIASGKGDPVLLSAKVATARFFIDQIAPQATALLPAATAGAAPIFALDEDQLSAA